VFKKRYYVEAYDLDTREALFSTQLLSWRAVRSRKEALGHLEAAHRAAFGKTMFHRMKERQKIEPPKRFEVHIRKKIGDRGSRQTDCFSARFVDRGKAKIC